MVFEAGDGVTPHAGKWGDELTKKAEENWVRDAEVIRLSDADQKELRKRVRPFADDILCNDPATKDMYALLKKAVAVRLCVDYRPGPFARRPGLFYAVNHLP